MVGTGVAVLLAWALSGGLAPPATTYDVEAQPWSSTTVSLPEGAGTLMLLRRPADPSGREHERRLRYRPAEGAPVELPLYGLGAAPVDLSLSWVGAEHPIGPAVWIEDDHGTLVVDVTRSMLRRVWQGHGRTWLVDVSGPGVDGSGRIQVEGDEVRFVATGPARVLDITGDWPPADVEPLGRFVQDGPGVRLQR